MTQALTNCLPKASTKVTRKHKKHVSHTKINQCSNTRTLCTLLRTRPYLETQHITWDEDCAALKIEPNQEDLFLQIAHNPNFSSSTTNQPSPPRHPPATCSNWEASKIRTFMQSPKCRGASPLPMPHGAPPKPFWIHSQTSLYDETYTWSSVIKLRLLYGIYALWLTKLPPNTWTHVYHTPTEVC